MSSPSSSLPLTSSSSSSSSKDEGQKSTREIKRRASWPLQSLSLSLSPSVETHRNIESGFGHSNNQMYDTKVPAIHTRGPPSLLELVFSPHLLLGPLRSLSHFLTDVGMVLFMRTCRPLYQTEYPTVTLQYNYYYASEIPEGEKCIPQVAKVNWDIDDTLESPEWRAIKSLNVLLIWKGLVPSIAINTTLLSLDLSNNHLGDEGARNIGKALQMNSTLTHIDLTANSIGNEGACAIAELLNVNTALKDISLDCNEIGNNGFFSICEALKTNTSLESITFYGNDIVNTEGIATFIKDALEVNKLVEIDF